MPFFENFYIFKLFKSFKIVKCPLSYELLYPVAKFEDFIL